MPDLLDIYQHEAPKYDLLVSREDYQGNLLPALGRVGEVQGKRVVEFGAGTGRLTAQLAPIVRSIQAFDASESMLDVARTKLQALGLSNWSVDVADHRRIPVGDGVADVSVAAWSICCLAAYTGDLWEHEVETGLTEMARVVAPGGRIVVIETLGTGYSSPNAPEELKPYYSKLASMGFSATWIRTDYRFQSMDEALDLTRFFFGTDPVNAINTSSDGIVLPECTGIWWKSADGSG